MQAGESVDVELAVEAPPQPGSFTLALEPVLEFVSWFGAHDPAAVRRVAVEVVAP